MGDIEHLDFSPEGSVTEALLKAWRKPIEPGLERMAATMDKPLAELTMPDVLAWGLVLAYALATGMVIGQVAGNIAVNVLRSPVRLR